MAWHFLSQDVNCAAGGKGQTHHHAYERGFARTIRADQSISFSSVDDHIEVINRAEFSIEEARKRGGDTVVTLETPKL